LNETLYYEPAYEPVGDALAAEFDYQVPEYINPEWDDDALYHLICANQDVLVDVSGNVMTLSAAMNQHPGPWTPENEANLIAYAEGLLANTFIVPAAQEEVPEEAKNEPVYEQDQAEDPPTLKIEEQVKVEYKPEIPEPQQVKSVPLQIDNPIIPPEPIAPALAEAADRASGKTINHSHESDVKPEIAERDRAPDVVITITEPDDHTDVAEQRLEPALKIEVEEPQVLEYIQTEELEPLETAELSVAEVMDEVLEENDTAVDDIVLDIGYKQIDDATADEPVEQRAFEDEHEVPFIAPELFVDAISLDLPTDHIPDSEDTDQTNTTEHDQPEQIVATIEDVESALRQLTELIGSETAEDDEQTNVILNKIFEAPTNLMVETKEEWAIFYVEIFEAAGIDYAPELIERLSAMTVERNLFDEVKCLNDTDCITAEGEDGSTRMMIKKLLVAIVNIIQAIRHVFTIGTYVLKLSVVPRVGYQ